MLVSLHITNFLLIEQALIDFSKSLNIITGETGAGKSIILDSLLIVSGQRIRPNLIRQPAESAIISVSFDISNNELIKNKLTHLAILFDEELIIRRVIYKNNKTKCFLNDQLVSAKSVKEITTQLLEFHSQNEQHKFFNSTHYLASIDQYGNLVKEQSEVAKLYQEWQKSLKIINQIIIDNQELQKQQDYLNFVAVELSSLNLLDNEEQDLVDQRNLLINRQKILDNFTIIINKLDGEVQTKESIKSAIRLLNKSNNSLLDKIIQRLEQASFELDEAINELNNYYNALEAQEDNLDQIEQRLFLLRATARKYRCSVRDLPHELKIVQEKLQKSKNQEELINKAELIAREQEENFFKSAKELSNKRKKFSKEAEQLILNELIKLKLERAEFKIQISPNDLASIYGIDKVEFLISTNPGMPICGLVDVSSGGELSRIMLAMKVILASKRQAATIIFDEIDTGIGGAIAYTIGNRLAILSKSAQVIAITHQPQIAAKANNHIHVTKNQTNNSTKTLINSLSLEQKEQEIARMISGESISNEARMLARQLLNQ